MRFSRKEESEVVSIVQRLVEFIHKNDIKNIILLDRSARPAYIGFSKVWREEFPKSKKPQLYFVNPDGFNTITRSAREVDEDFRRTYRGLVQKNDEKVMVFDTCYHTGETAGSVLDSLKRVGFKEVLLGSTQPSRSNCIRDLDFEALDYEPRGICYPFDRDYMVRKSRDRVVSSITINPTDRKDAISLRKSICRIFEEAGY